MKKKIIVAIIVILVYGATIIGMTTNHNRVMENTITTYEKKMKDQYNKGYEIGKNDGLAIGWDNGYDDGYGDGYYYGYNDGYKKGVNDEYSEFLQNIETYYQQFLNGLLY